MNQVKYGLDAGAMQMDAVAKSVEAALKMSLYPQHSPMDGPRYSSVNLAPIFQAIRTGDAASVARLQALEEADPQVELRRNDPEPGYLSVEHPSGGTYILEMRSADLLKLQALEEALRSVALPMRKLA